MFLSMSDRRWVINKESGEFLLHGKPVYFNLYLRASCTGFTYSV